MTEEQLQCKCFQWHWNEYPNERRMLWHNNNNTSSALQGAKNKARGVVAGVADFTLVTDGGVVFIELKLPGERQKPEQQNFEVKVLMKGAKYYIVYSFEEFKTLIQKLYGSN